MEVSNPRRVLAVGQSGSGLLDLMKGSTGLTGSLPVLNNEIIAGTTHNWIIQTNYYKANIPIWLDELTSPSAWAAEFLAPEAREVLESLGAFIVCFKKPANSDDLDEIQDLLHNMCKVVKEGFGLTWDGICLAVAMPQTFAPHLEKSFDEWEKLCQESGFEFIDFEMKERNEYLEPMGLDRLREALESNDWENKDQLMCDLDLDDYDGVNDDVVNFGFQIETAQLEKEIYETRQDIQDNNAEIDTEVGDSVDYDNEVENLQTMFLRMQAVRDAGVSFSNADRKKMAIKAVNDLMKTL